MNLYEAMNQATYGDRWIRMSYWDPTIRISWHELRQCWVDAAGKSFSLKTRDYLSERWEPVPAIFEDSSGWYYRDRDWEAVGPYSTQEAAITAHSLAKN